MAEAAYTTRKGHIRWAFDRLDSLLPDGYHATVHSRGEGGWDFTLVDETAGQFGPVCMVHRDHCTSDTLRELADEFASRLEQMGAI